ncbi:MAG TPA: hypothetical protein VJ997_12710 [Longimicrobiales bacterium]|nr:hypothetical protein [Longimicrobiales bacterium]
MRRRYLAYLIVALLPSFAAVTAGLIAGRAAWTEFRTAAWTWVGTTALNAFQADLVATVASLTAAAEPTQVDPDDAAWDRVSRGDTVSALRPRGSGAEVMVLMPPRPGDPPGSLRYAGAPLPTAPLTAATAAGSRLSLYLNGRRALSTRDSLGPDTLPRQTLLALSAASGGLAVSGNGAGALVALDHAVGLPPSVAVMVGPVVPPAPAPPRSLVLATALLLLFALVVGWIQLGADVEGSARRRVSLPVVSLLPVFTALGFLVQSDRMFHEAVRAGTTQNLTRALAVSSARGVAGSPDRVHELTGFQATRVRAGSVEESTLEEPLAPLAGLPAPPPSFTSSGTVTTAEGPSLYAALRLPGDDVIVASARLPDARTQAFRRTLFMVAAALGAWLLVAGWMAGIGATPARE